MPSSFCFCLERRRGRGLEGLGRRESDAQLRLRQFQWLDLRLLLQQRVDVRHADHGILVVEPQPFVLHALCQPFVKRLHAISIAPAGDSTRNPVRT